MDKAKGTKIIFKNKKIDITINSSVDSNVVDSNLDANVVNSNVVNSNLDANIVLDNESMTIKYIQQLNPLQLIGYEIAKSRLKSSFDIEKSIGFKSFIS